MFFDIADSHVARLRKSPRVSGGSLNVGNSRGFSILEVIDAAERVTGPKSLANSVRAVPVILRFSLPARKNSKRALGWEASILSLEEIIGSAWMWKQKYPRGYAESSNAPA